MKKTLQLILAVIICQAAGAIGTIFTASAIPTWYETLVKPGFQPPNWLFGPVWLTLYTMMGISVFLIWNIKLRKFKKQRKMALWLFGIQLTLNAIWTPIFFGAHWLGMALVVIAFLWVFILLCIYKFYPFSKWASYLLVPYLLWVSFATVLNYSLIVLN